MTPAAKKALELLAKEFKDNPPVSFTKAGVKAEPISTGSLILNQLFGCGGWPRGRIVELFGPEHSGKTTLCLHAIAEAQKIGVVAFVDTEHRAELSYASALGVDCESLIFNQPSGGEDAFNKIEKMLSTKLFSMIVLDSIAHAKPKVIEDSDINASNIGAHAKMMTKVMDRVGKKLGNTCLLMTNQIRKDPSGYGSGETTPGGLAVKFDASLRVRLSRSSTEKDKEDNPTHNIVTAKVVKTSIGGIPYKEAKFTIRFGEGVAIADDTLDAGILSGFIIKTGGNHSIIVHGKKETIGRSRDQALLWLNQKGRAEKIRKAIVKTAWYTGEEGERVNGGTNEEVSRDGMVEEGSEADTEVPTVREYVLRTDNGPSSSVQETEDVDDRGDTDGTDEEEDDSDDGALSI